MEPSVPPQTASETPATAAPGPTPAPPAPSTGTPRSPGAEPRAEDTIWIGRPHWLHQLNTVLVAVLVLVGIWVALVFMARWDWLTRGTVAKVGLGLTVLIGVIVTGRILLRVLSRRYRVTSQRLFLERGIFNLTIDQTELIRVDDVRVRKSFIDRLVGLGTVEILSTDATNRGSALEGIKEPDRLAELIRGNMRTLRGRSLFVENL